MRRPLATCICRRPHSQPGWSHRHEGGIRRAVPELAPRTSAKPPRSCRTVAGGRYARVSASWGHSRARARRPSLAAAQAAEGETVTPELVLGTPVGHGKLFPVFRRRGDYKVLARLARPAAPRGWHARCPGRLYGTSRPALLTDCYGPVPPRQNRMAGFGELALAP